MDDGTVKQIIYPRVFIPIEKRNLDGTMQFCTSDREVYLRDLNGAIRRKTPKVKKHHGPRRG